MVAEVNAVNADRVGSRYSAQLLHESRKFAAIDVLKHDLRPEKIDRLIGNILERTGAFGQINNATLRHRVLECRRPQRFDCAATCGEQAQKLAVLFDAGLCERTRIS